MMVLIFTFRKKKSHGGSFTCKQDRVNWLKFGFNFYSAVQDEEF